MTPERQIINRALFRFRPFSQDGKLVRELVDLCERLLAGSTARRTDEAALRREIDDGPAVSLLAWADLLEEQGHGQVAEGMRWLARNGKWPGAVRCTYRWAAVREEWGDGASWTLPVRAVRMLYGLGGGRWKTASEAILAASQVMAIVNAEGSDDDDDPFADVFGG